MATDKCARCCGPRDRPGQHYCRACHASYMRGARKRHSELTPEQRVKANARTTANVYQSRGLLVPRTCEGCGSRRAQKHHADYSRPLDVTWLCRPCHLARHREEDRLKPSKRRFAASIRFSPSERATLNEKACEERCGAAELVRRAVAAYVTRPAVGRELETAADGDTMEA